jgi:hypothetical protein
LKKKFSGNKENNIENNITQNKIKITKGKKEKIKKNKVIINLTKENDGLTKFKTGKRKQKSKFKGIILSEGNKNSFSISKIKLKNLENSKNKS